MKKHEELTSVNSCLNKAADDEPLFVLRATDPAAPAAIRAWIEERIAIGKNTRSDEKTVSAAAMADDMQAYGEKVAE